MLLRARRRRAPEHPRGRLAQPDGDALPRPLRRARRRLRRLAGLNLLHGFRRAVNERLGGVLGCTHLTELTQVLPTAVIQAFAGEVIDTRGQAESSEKPFQLDRCHALRADGPAVRTYYPRWYRAAAERRVRSPRTTRSTAPFESIA